MLTAQAQGSAVPATDGRLRGAELGGHHGRRRCGRAKGKTLQSVDDKQATNEQKAVVKCQTTRHWQVGFVRHLGQESWSENVDVAITHQIFERCIDDFEDPAQESGQQ